MLQTICLCPNNQRVIAKNVFNVDNLFFPQGEVIMQIQKEVILENKIRQNNSKITQLEIQLENMARQEEQLLMELKVTSDQLATFINKRDNFTEENWNELNKHQQELDTKLRRELDNIRNPLKTKRAYDSLHVQSHWLYVK